MTKGSQILKKLRKCIGRLDDCLTRYGETREGSEPTLTLRFLAYLKEMTVAFIKTENTGVGADLGRSLKKDDEFSYTDFQVLWVIQVKMLSNLTNVSSV